MQGGLYREVRLRNLVLTPIHAFSYRVSSQIEADDQTSSNVHMKILYLTIQSWMIDKTDFCRDYSML